MKKSNYINYVNKYTQILGFILVFGFYKISAQDTIFNTVKRSDHKGIVSNLTEKEQTKREAKKIKIAELKIEYNMGVLPLDSIFITSSYGVRRHPVTGKVSNHRGVDLRGVDKNVYAVQDGIVVDKGYSKLLGQFLHIQCGSYTFIYGHLKHIFISKGDVVKCNEVIGNTGGTGRVTAEHLHFAIKNGKDYMDPYPILFLLSGEEI